MARVIANPREALDHHRHPWQGPELGTEAMGHRSTPQGRVDPRELPPIQTRLAPEPASRLQPTSTLPTPCVIPPMCRLATHAQRPNDCGLRLSTRKQPCGLEPPRFQRRNIPLPTLWLRHASAWHRSSLNLSLY